MRFEESKLLCRSYWRTGTKGQGSQKHHADDQNRRPVNKPSPEHLRCVSVSSLLEDNDQPN